ncbi:molybdenum cofactor biosynthesis protein C [Luminiphilus syltensis NOR5-1B]|uniref:Molybdenum cofactor biosynthesis protein C n=2 Tax=Luminiphilus TaxID=1341118 RepID=B8KRP2_9GAMM|nr:molybdenum cofactor biosynthesis protein C [Luminiphilus syltensis NOR5-1B]
MIRETLDTESLQIDWAPSLADVESLKSVLSSRGATWADTLNETSVIAAVNQQVVSADHPLADGDEVAFFPPMTGG